MARRKNQKEIRRALLNASYGGYSFENWRRVVKTGFALFPLSSKGSRVSTPGGRFNIGKVDPKNFPPFPALYIAENRETALQEVLAQNPDQESGLSGIELALANPESIADYSVSGRLNEVINLMDPKPLQGFVDIIGKFRLSNETKELSRKLWGKTPGLVATLDGLLSVLLDKNWRKDPYQFDVPATCQIFGQLVAEAGLEAILYPSKLTGSPCLAIFPQNFRLGAVHVKLDDRPPSDAVIRILNHSTVQDLL